MRRTKRTVWLLLAFSALIIVAIGCSSTKKNEASTQPTVSTTEAPKESTGAAAAGDSDWEWKKDTSPFEFDMWVGYSWAKGTYDSLDNNIAKNITKKTGVKYNVTLPPGNEGEALNLLIASNNLLDVIVYDYSSPQVQKLIDGGLVYSYDELIEKYAPNMKKLISADDRLYHTQKDGKVYYLPNFPGDAALQESTFQKTNDPVYFARNDIYEKLGKPKMETPDELFNVLKTIKKDYPDLIPFRMEEIEINGMFLNDAIENIIRGFGINVAAIYQDGDEVKYLFRDPKYIEGMKFVNKLFREGIITPEQLTEKSSQIEEKFNNGKYFMITDQPWNVYSMLNTTLAKNLKDPAIKYVMSDIFKAPGETPQYVSMRSKGWMAVLVTKTAKNPERIIKFLEYAFSDEGQIDNLLGVEGETYDLVNGEPVLKPEYQTMMAVDRDAFTKVGFNHMPYFIRAIPFDKYGRSYESGPEAKEDYKIISPYAVDHFKLGYADINPNRGTKEATTNQKVKEVWAKYLIKMIMAKTDAEFDKAHENGLEEVDNIGADTVEKVMTDKHKAELKAIAESK